MIFLFLNSIAGSEIVVILLFVLIFFGSKSIPGLARALGRGVRQLKDATQDVQDEIRKTTSDMRSDMRVNRTIEEVKKDFSQPMDQIADAIKDSTTSIQEDVKLKDSVPHQPKVKHSVKPSIEKETPTIEDTEKNTKPEENQPENNDSSSKDSTK